MAPLEAQARHLKAHRLKAARASGGASSNVILRRVLKVIQGLNLRGDVLDFGAGVGDLTRMLWDLDCFERIAGTDILPRPANLRDEISWHTLDLNAGSALTAESFHAVIAAEVIEHLENPRETARHCYRLLKPGGTLVLSTPNNESLRSLAALVVRGHFVAFDDSCYPAHITALLRKDLIRILAEAGFHGVRFAFTDSGGLPKVPSITWQQVSFGLLKGRRFSDNLIAIATK